MKAKRISQKAVKNMINGFDTYGKCLPLQPTVNKKPKPIANKFTTWFLTTIQQHINSTYENGLKQTGTTILQGRHRVNCRSEYRKLCLQ